jgi:hypothetical protein
MNLMLTLVLISVFGLLALVFLSRAGCGKRIAQGQAACWIYFALMAALGVVWKLDYELFVRITEVGWGLAQEAVYRSKDVVLVFLDWMRVHVQILIDGESNHFEELFSLD